MYVNIDVVCKNKKQTKKAHQKAPSVHFYHKLCSFNVYPAFMKTFNSCFIKSVLAFHLLGWVTLCKILNSPAWYHEGVHQNCWFNMTVI